MAFSSTLKKLGNIEIGLQFEKVDLSPDLNIGHTLAILNLSGKIPLTKEKFINLDYGSAIGIIENFIILTGMLSKPELHLFFKLDTMVNISLASVGNKTKEEEFGTLR